MTEQTIRPWQQVENQGYNLYGKMNGRTIIGPGSSEAINSGVNMLAEDNNPVELRVAHRKTKIRNLWDGGYNYPERGDIIMKYGKQPTDYMAQDWQEYGKRNHQRYLMDRNYSVAPKVMETTYVDAKTGEYLTGRLGKDSKEVITGFKKAHTGMAFFPEGTPILSTEALKKGKTPVLSKPFQTVAMDIEGCYLMPFKNLVKKYKGTDAASEQVHKLAKQFWQSSENATGCLKKGLITKRDANRVINEAWELFLNAIKKVKI